MKRAIQVVLAVLLASVGFFVMPNSANAASIETFLFTLSIGNTIGGVNYDEDDILKYDHGVTTRVFDGDTLFKANNEKIDALTRMPDGDFIISTSRTADIGSLHFSDLDLVRFNPVTLDASLFLDGDAVFESVQNVKSVDVLSSGKIVMSAGQGTIGNNNLEFNSKDLVLYDPVSGNASLFFDGSEHFEGKKGSIDGVDVLPDGKLVLIVGDDTDALIGGGVHVDRKNIFLYDPTTKTAEIIIDGRDNYFQRTSHRHDQGFESVFVPPTDEPPVVPEPVTSSLFGLGLLGAGVFTRRNKLNSSKEINS